MDMEISSGSGGSGGRLDRLELDFEVAKKAFSAAPNCPDGLGLDPGGSKKTPQIGATDR